MEILQKRYVPVQNLETLLIENAHTHTGYVTAVWVMRSAQGLKVYPIDPSISQIISRVFTASGQMTHSMNYEVAPYPVIGEAEHR